MKRALLLLLLTACEAPAPVTPILSVLRRTPACFALMTPAQPPADALGLSDTCDDPVPPVAFTGTDLIETIVDYGDQVDFETTATAPAPELTVTVDGEPVDLAIDLSPHRVRARAFFIATFRAPAKSSANVRIAASVESGFAAESPTVFSTVPAPVSIAVAECQSGLACDLVGAVGQVHATVAIPADVGVPVTIHQTIDGVALPDATAQTVAGAAGRSVATIALDIRAGSPATAAATWQLDAQVGEGHAAPVAIRLARPVIAAQLSCGAHCTLPKGAVVGLEIDTPPDIHPQRALLTSRLGGVPQQVDLPIDLLNGVGLVSLTAPSTGVGAWTIDVTVAGYAAPTIEASVQ